MVKSYPSKYGVIASDIGVQILGGSGYIREYPLEQYYRDNRLNPIHEGTEGIHGLDLLGRKLQQHGGAGYRLFLGQVAHTLDEAGRDPRCSPMSYLLAGALERLERVTDSLLAQVAEDASLGLCNATPYLDLFGRVLVGWLWLRMARVSSQALDAGAQGSEADFYHGKLQAARYFMDWELAGIDAQAQLLISANRSSFDMQNHWF